MYCNRCGKMIPDDAAHCAYCGKQLTGVVTRRRLVRPRTGRKLAGVCLGFAEYFDLDVTNTGSRGLGVMRSFWIMRRDRLRCCVDHRAGRTPARPGAAEPAAKS